MKFDSGTPPQALPGAQFKIYPNTSENTPDYDSPLDVNPKSNGSVFESGELQPHTKYWLKETKAPGRAENGQYSELLPQPLLFEINDDRIQIYSGGTAESNKVTPVGGVAKADGGSFVVDSSENGNAFAIKVYDPRAMELPLSGGIGRWPIVALGVLVVVISMLFMVKTSGVSRRRD